MKIEFSHYMLIIALIVSSAVFLNACAHCGKAELKESPRAEQTQFSPSEGAIAPDTNIAQSDLDQRPQVEDEIDPNSFALNAYRVLAQEGENLFFSPASIYTAFSMVYEGALEQTKDEIKAVFGFSNDKVLQHEIVAQLMASLQEINDSGQADMSLSNALFCDQRQLPRLNESFRDKLARYYKSELFLVDYSQRAAAAERINSWVEDKTHDRIHNLVSEENFDDETALSVLNAIYFKANWKYQFDESQTQDGRFYKNLSNRSDFIPSRMMTQSQSYPVAQFRGFKMLEMPYENEDLSMLLILPDDIEDFQEQLTEQNLKRWVADLYLREAFVMLPKFKLTHSLQGLPATLKIMGLQKAFDRQDANLRGIFNVRPSENVYIQDVLHKAFIEVNEEGSEAAASTAVIIGITRSGPIDQEQPFYFRADHPFIYMIRHRPSGRILFMGKLTDPSLEE